MADAPETLEAPIAEEGGSRFDARRLAIILAAVLVVFALVWLFFLRGGGEMPPPENLPDLGAETQSPTPDETAADRDNGRNRVETFEVFAARDPFEPLVGAGDAGDDGDDGGEPVPDDGTPDDDGGFDDTDGDGDAGGDGDGGGSVGGHRVRVVDVFPRGERAQVQVDGTVYTVDEEETFAENFQLVRAEGRCATMLFGDDEFTLCEGEEILK
jgi:hypothetical protein